MDSSPTHRAKLAGKPAGAFVTDIAALEPVTVKRRHVTAAVVGNALEFYDFTTYSFFAAAIGHAFFPTGPGGLSNTEFGSLMLSLGTFGAGFALRPIGGIVIGHYADRIGRRPAMLLSFTLMGLAILALAFIPSYSRIGLAAPLLAIAARLAQGFALGGEVGPSTAYLVEAAPPLRRGLYASWQSASQSLAAMAGGTVGVVLALNLSPENLEVYGWRIAFVLGALTLPFGLYIRRSLPETLHAPDHLPDYVPPGLLRILRDHFRPILLGFMILTGGTVATYVLNYMTTFARTTLHLGASPSFAATLVNGLFGVLASLAGGLLSDRFGRRGLMIVPRGLFLLAAWPVFFLIVAQHSTSALLLGTAVLSILLNVSSGAFYVAFIEILPKRVRGVVFATVYATAIAVFGGTTQPMVALLMHVTGNPLAMAWYLMAATAVSLVAMLLMEESAPAAKAAP
ncbi:MAG TPA: MFS transporter [Rhizomicrobium sp.]|jgi:MHS family citrate/tricarballylate:H+ symporter-like MFS transporter|nr:MFS transporter [Rhizomicrobium sp.]